MSRTIHRAKLVLAEADLILHDAAVHVSANGRVTRVEPWQSATLEPNVVDWGSAAIIPGLVNTHTHLELTGLRGQVTGFSSFTDWLGQLIKKRSQWSRDEYLESARRGGRMALSAGTTLVGDISASGVTWQALKNEKLRKVIFEEIFSLQPENTVESLELLETRLDAVKRDDLLTSGVSPHAPYSVSAQLYQGIFDLARRRGMLLATHTAETTSELEFLQTGTGEFRSFLANLGALPSDWQPPGLAPVSYFEQLGIMSSPNVLIHCNHLDQEAMDTIRRSRSSVVYCPRSHAFFGHAQHPVRQLLDLGVNVALGTDSLASNETLSILDEMRFLFARRKDLKSEEIFRMATLNGAAALGFAGVLGRLRRGYWADMTVLKLREDVSPKNLTSHILEGEGECLATIVRGEIAWRS